MNIFNKINFSLTNISSWIILNFFLLSAIDAILKINGVDLQYDKILDLAIVFLTLLYITNKNFIQIKVLIAFYLLYLLFTVAINDYANKNMLTYFAIKTTWIPIMLFYIGQNRKFSTDLFYKNMIAPLLISLLFGIWYFFRPPSWYSSFRNNLIENNASDFLIQEIFRMSSFWPAPQFIGYSCFVLITYLLFSYYSSKKISLWETLVLIIAIFSIFLIQLRVVILGAALSFIFFNLWSLVYIKKNIKKFILFIFLLICLFLYLNSSIFSNNEFLEYKINSILNFQESAKDRIDVMQNVKVTQYYKISFLGHGMGRFAIAASQFNMPDLRDGGYIKEIMESGILGFSILLLVLIPSIIRTVYYIRYLSLEFIILLFYLIALIGANCISDTFTLNVVFWLNLGRIWNPYLLIRRQLEKSTT